MVRWLWELLRGFSLDQKRAWLQVGAGGPCGRRGRKCSVSSRGVPARLACSAWLGHPLCWSMSTKFLSPRSPFFCWATVHNGQRPGAGGGPGPPAAADPALRARHRAPTHRSHLLQRAAAARCGQWADWAGCRCFGLRGGKMRVCLLFTTTCSLPGLHLWLAEYSSKEKLRQKLLLAIGWAQGFGLK